LRLAPGLRQGFDRKANPPVQIISRVTREAVGLAPRLQQTFDGNGFLLFSGHECNREFLAHLCEILRITRHIARHHLVEKRPASVRQLPHTKQICKRLRARLAILSAVARRLAARPFAQTLNAIPGTGSRITWPRGSH